MPARTRISLITTMFMVVAVATACHSGSPAPPAPGLTTSAPSPLVLPTKDALDAYRAMWDAVVSAAKTADPDAPGLRRYATDKALARIVMVLYLDHEQDQVVLGTLAMAPSVDAEESTGTEIHIRDCVDTSLWLVYRASGGLVDDTPGGPHATAATVTDSGGHWMVSTLDIGEVQTC